jgi:hypothetical protein
MKFKIPAWVTSREGHKRMEGIGLVLILASFIIQLEEIKVDNAVIESQNYYIEDKLDKIWKLSTTDYSQRHHDSLNTGATNLNSYVNDWKIYSQNRAYLENWQKGVLASWITGLRIWIFILGSILVIAPKFIREK